MNRLASSLVWFIIAAAFAKFFGIDGLSEQDEHAKWELHEATITGQSVALNPFDDDYQLSLDFEIIFNNQTRSYESYKISGAKGYIERLAKGEYATGRPIDILVNPDDRAQFAFPKTHSLGPYLVGFIPAGFFTLIGLSVLFSKAKKPV